MDSPSFPNDMRTLSDFQDFHRWLDERNHFNQDILLNMVMLSGEIGEVAQVLKQIHWMSSSERMEQREAVTPEEALAAHREHLGEELADCLAYVFKLANYTGVDLQEAYRKKMVRNMQRTWKYAGEDDTTPTK